MQKWIYKSLIRGPYHSARMSVAEMNKQGENGWELITILYPDSDGDTNLEYVFKKIDNVEYNFPGRMITHQ